MSAFSHFLSVRDGRQAPRFQRARALRVPASAIQSLDLRAHDAAVSQLKADEAANAAIGESAQPSLLDLKIALATRELDACRLCPHECEVNRNAGKRGFCGVTSGTAVHWEGVLHGEELELVPSHEVFVSGCTMRCAFCYSHRHITRPMSGSALSPSELARRIEARHAEGATNLNLVGGEPTLHIPNILRTLRELRAPLPVVWNSNLYATPHAMQLLDGVVDLFLGDIHFGPDCALELGRVPRYWESVTRSLQMAHASGASVVIRHLVMPGHLECCARAAMEWATRTLPTVPFHLMLQYVPDYRARGDRILGRPLSRDEMARVQEMARELNVNLYRDASHAAQRAQRETVLPALGDSVDILIHDDGRVSFTRLTGELLPVANALNTLDPRVSARGKGLTAEAQRRRED